MDKIAELEAFIEHVMKTDGAQGLGISVINRNGEELYGRCFGYRDEAARLPFDEDTLVGVASITKSFTALAVMQLHELGIIDVTQHVKTYIPEFRYESITVSQLLSHTAGFLPIRRKQMKDACEALNFPVTEDPFLSTAVAEYGRRELLEDLNGQKEFTGRPGENFSYSNDCFALLAEIVRVYGGERTFSEYVGKRILRPLGMTGSGIRMQLSGENVSKLYQRRTDGMLADDWTTADDQSPLPGASGMRSTIRDMKQYVLMYLNGGKLPNGTRVAGEYAIREMSHPRVTCDLNAYYGYGIMSWAENGMTVWGHGGDQPGVSAQFDWSDETGIGCVVLCNTSQVTASAISAAAMRLFSGYNMERASNGLLPVEWPDKKMSLLCGSYSDGEGNHVTIGKADKLFTVCVDGANTIAYPINNHMLIMKRTIEDMIVTIHFNEDGTVKSLSGGYRIIPKDS